MNLMRSSLVVIPMLLLTSCVSMKKYRAQESMAQTLSDAKADLERQLAELNQEKDSLEQELAAVKGEKESLVKSLESRRDQLSQDLAKLTRERDALAEELRRTAQEKDAEIARLQGTYDQLVSSLRNEISRGEIEVTQLRDKLSVKLVDKILFDSGKADVTAQGREVLKRIGDIVNKVEGKDIQVAGHTDNVPIGGALKNRYPSNWELSTARATNIVRYLQENTSLAPERLAAAGYGQYQPVAPNDTEEGRAQNRRIEIVLVDAARPDAASVSKSTATRTP